jgi:hypothetical protein
MSARRIVSNKPANWRMYSFERHAGRKEKIQATLSAASLDVEEYTASSGMQGLKKNDTSRTLSRSLYIEEYTGLAGIERHAALAGPPAEDSLTAQALESPQSLLMPLIFAFPGRSRRPVTLPGGVLLRRD